jgi:26S proteasome regulatory subunit T3
MDGFD